MEESDVGVPSSCTVLPSMDSPSSFILFLCCLLGHGIKLADREMHAGVHEGCVHVFLLDPHRLELSPMADLDSRGCGKCGSC